MSENLKFSLRQFLTFVQDGDVFGIDIDSIKEVLEIREITNIPRSLEFMRGIINLRGQVVPVIDLKLKFGFDQTEFTIDTCIIILEVTLDDGELCLLGVLTDSVREVINLDANDISPPPKIGSSIDSEFIYGVGKYGNEFIVILDALKLCSHEEMDMLHDMSAQQATA